MFGEEFCSSADVKTGVRTTARQIVIVSKSISVFNDIDYLC